MQYYQELLESFDKLKKRKFKLTIMEQGDPTQQIIGILRGYARSAEWSADIPELKGGFRVRVSEDGSLNVMDLSMQRQAKVTSPQGQRVEETGTAATIWQNMIAALGGEEAAPVEGEGQLPEQYGAGAPAGATIEEHMIGLGDPFLAAITADTFRDINKDMGDIYEDLSEEDLEGMGTLPGGSPEGFAGSFSGARPGSLESSLTKATKWETDDDGLLIGTQDSLSPGTLHLASEKVRRLAELARKDKITDAEAMELKDSFGYNGDGTIFIRIQGKEGLKINDNGKALRTVMGNIEKQMGPLGHPFPKINIKAKVAGSSSWRGLNLERVSVIRAYAKECAMTRARSGMQGAEVSGDVYLMGFHACVAHKRELAAFMEEADKWRIAHEWTHNFFEDEMGVIDSDDEFILQSAINDGLNTGQNLHKMLRVILQMSQDDDLYMDPDMVIRSGTTTGGGRRADVQPLWRPDEDGSCGKATQGLLNRGFSQADITKHRMIETVPAEVAFEGNPEAFDDYTKMFGGDATSPICRHGTGLKHYEHGLGGGIKIGEMTFKVEDAVLENAGLVNEKMRNGAAWVDHREYVMKTLGINSTQDANMMALHKRQREVDHLVRNIPANATVRDEYGAIVAKASNQVKWTADKFKDMITNNSDVVSLFDSNTAIGEAYTTLKDLLHKQGGKQGLNSNEGRQRFSELASRFLRHRQLMNEIGKGNQAAKDLLATKIYLTGGSNDTNLGHTSNAKSLREEGPGKERANLQFRHNHGLDLVRAWRNNGTFEHPDEWATEPSVDAAGNEIPGVRAQERVRFVPGDGFTPRFELASDKEAYVSLESIGESKKSKVTGKYTRLTRTEANYSRRLLDIIKAKPLHELNTDTHNPINNVIEEYLENQREILTKIFEAR